MSDGRIRGGGLLERLRWIAGSAGRKLREPRWRHGGLGAMMTAGFAALCILVNMGVGALEARYGWRRDYSFNGYASTGPETRAAMDRLTRPVTLYLLCLGMDADSRLLELLRRYGALNSLVRVEPADIAKNPGILARFQSDLGHAPEADSVIVSCEETGRYKVLAQEDFVSWAYHPERGRFEPAGLIYEKRLTEAILFVTEAVIPMMGILEGHGELPAAELENFTRFLRQNQYDVKTVTLRSESALDEVDLLLMAGLRKDLSGEEVGWLDAFAKRGGSFMVLRDFTDPLNMPNYMALLKNYGVVPLPGVVMAGEEDADSYLGEPVYLIPFMRETDMTGPLIAGNMDYLLLAGAGAFRAPVSNPSLTVETVLAAGENAYVHDFQNAAGNAGDGEDGPLRGLDFGGELSLALNARRMHPSGEISRMFAIGNSALFTEEYMYQSTFNEAFAIQIMSQLLPQKAVSLDIMARSAFHPGLKAGGHTLGLLLIVAAPMASLAAALVVLLPRKRR